MTKLRIATDLSLPIEAVTEALGFLGRRGSGKTYAAQKLAEEMHKAGAQFVALDPVGVWYGLRLAANGKDPGIAIPVLGGLRGDVPIEPHAGKIVADLVVDKGISVVVDVSQFESDADKARFATDFATRFFFRKKSSPSAVHVFIEEAQEFVGQNPMKGEERMLHAFHRLIKLGRNFGIGVSLISQRPQEVNKKVLNQVELLFAFQLTGPQERKAVEGWIAEKGVDEDIAGELPKLKRGAPHAWSPAWLQMSRVVQVAEKWTFDASSTPKVGAGAKVRELAPIDIEQLGAEIKATAERARAEDPKELKKRIVELERRIRQAGNGQKTVEKIVVDTKAVDRAVGAAVSAERKRFRPLLATIRSVERGISQMASGMAAGREGLTATVNELAKLLDAPPPEFPAPMPSARANFAQPRGAPPPRLRTPAAAKTGQVVGAIDRDGDQLSGSQQQILNTLASLAATGIDSPSRNNVAALSGVSSTSGGYFNNLGRLRSLGLIEYPAAGLVSLTDPGRSLATADVEIGGVGDLHQAWFARLSGAQARVLERLVAIYPDAIRKDELADDIGVSRTSGGYFNTLGSLRSLGLIDYPSKGEVTATALLFPEQLAS